MVHGISSWLPDKVLEHFDIIGFDPRGVGLSEPAFACGGPGEQIALLETIDLPIDTPDEIAAGEAAANLCIQSMGPIGGLLHSQYVANDMDEIRKALGADQISYLGFSYGSTLGVWYATLFPESVRAMVVDGADNPVDAATTQQERLDEAVEEIAPFAASLEQALAACADPQCPIYNDGDPVGYFKQAVAKLDLVNAAAGNHPLAGVFGVISTLYSEEYWPSLWDGLFELNQNDDPFILLDFASIQLGPEPTLASFTGHVNCLDSWILPPVLDRATLLDDIEVVDTTIKEMFPLLALLDPSFHNACPFYDQFAPEPLKVPLDGAGVPILVVGNRSDPFTPFSESEELVIETLSNGYLVETSHPTHTVYPDNQCVNDHIHRVLIDGVYPTERRPFCEGEAIEIDEPTIDRPFGPMRRYESERYPFSMLYPALWLEDPTAPGGNLVASFDGEGGSLLIFEENLIALGIGQFTLLKYEDYFLSGFTELEYVSDHSFIVAEGVAHIMEFTTPDATYHMLFHVFQSSIGFKAIYITLPDSNDELEDLIDYSLSSFQVY